MKSYLAFILLFFVFKSSYAQTKDDLNTISTGKWMYDLNPSPFVTLYKMNYFIDDSGNKKTIEQVLKDEDINIDSLPYAQIDFNDNLYLVTKKSKNNTLRFFKIIKETPDYFILCNQESEMCDCKSGTFFYLKSQHKLQRIQRAFSFSLKRDLISRLKDNNIPVPINHDNKNFCEILKEL